MLFITIIELKARFWRDHGIGEERGGLQQMLICLTERLLTVTRRTYYTYSDKYNLSGLTKGLKRWR